MESLKHLPNIEGRKYGTISIGYDRIDQMRGEIGVLESLAALVCGCTREELTIQKVQVAIAKLQSEVPVEPT